MKWKEKITIGTETTQEIGEGRSIRQGCCISPTQVIIRLEEIIKNCMKRRRKKISNWRKRVEFMRLAYDMVVVLAETKNKFTTMLRGLDSLCEEFGV